MGIPLNVRFDRYAELTGGLVQVTDEAPFILDPNGMSVVTGWLTLGDGVWSACYDPVSTAWTACYSAVVTVWSACYSAVTTTWTKL